MSQFSHTLIVLFFLITSLQVSAQRSCSSMDVLNNQIQQDPGMIHRMQLIESHTQQFAQSYSPSGQRSVITIPCVVHVIYNTSAENISEAQIQSQIDVLNEDFRRTNADAVNTPSAFQGVAADVEIEFCMATVDPDGNATTGITRKSSNQSSWGFNDDMKFTAQGGTDAWPTDQYLNMWVCNLGGGLLGYAQFPGGPSATDGVVMTTTGFGRIENVSFPFHLGRTTTHEVGHWLNLYHIWGDGGCGVDDEVGDTPESDAPNYGCATGHVSCGTTDMPENYMDYSDDDCMNIFTQGQKTRMLSMFTAGGARESLLSSNGCNGGGGVVCLTPGGLSSSGITEAAATISWVGPGSATGYNVRYKVTSAGSWTTTTTSGSPLSLSSLNACANYEFQVEAICDTALSGYSNSAVFTTEGCCEAPDVLSATNITDTTATLTWNNVSTASGGYNVRYRAIGAGAWVTTAESSVSHDIESLSPCTPYEFQVQTICDTGVTNFSASHTFSTMGCGNCVDLDYCAISMNTVDEYIINVTLNAIDNSSGADGGYGDYTNISTNLEQNATYPISMTPGFAGTIYSEYFKAWIDYNQDGDFNDPDEEIFDAGSTSSSTETGNITIPGNALLGSTRMRVSMEYSQAPTTCESNYDYGETEDYCVTIVAGGSVSCGNATGLTASGITETAADFSWTAASGANTYNVRYRATSAASWTTTGVATNSLVISGLDSCTQYEYQVQTVCDSSSSAYTGSYEFMTIGCDTTVSGYCISNGENAAYEYIRIVDIGELHDTTGDDGGYADFTSLSTNLAQDASYNVSLTPGFSSGSYDEYWRVWIDYNQDEDFEDADELAFDPGSKSNTTVTGTMDVPATALLGTTRMRVQMKYPDAGEPCEVFAYGEVQDYSVNILPASGSCGIPSGLATANVGDDSGELSWVAVSGALGYNVRHKAVTGTSWTTENTTNTNTLVSGLVSCTVYEFQVQTVCDSVTSAFSLSETFTTTGCDTTGGNGECLIYCVSAGSISNEEWIDAVTIGEISNYSGENGGYADFSGSIDANFKQGETYNVELQPGYSGTLYNEYWKIWIDYNQDRDFDDAGELAFDAGFVTNDAVSGSFAISDSALLGNTGMRVQMKYNDASTSCEQFQWGEVEDYCINITADIPAGPCAMPTNANVTNITDTTALVNGYGHPDATSYRIIYRHLQALSWTIRNTTNISITLTGLEPGKEYKYRIKLQCPSGWTDLSPKEFFTTGGASSCGIPENVTVSNVIGNAALVDWYAMTAASSYRVIYRATGDVNWTVKTRAVNYYPISGLAPLTSYAVRVKAECSGGWSDLSETVFFTTADGSVVCDVPTNVVASNITSNGAQIDWDEQPAASNYRLIYKKTSASSWTIKTIGTTTYNITGLDPSEAYQYRVRALCPQGWTELSANAEFTTSGAKLNEGRDNNPYIRLAPNPAKDFVMISYAGTEGETLEFTIFDVYGRKVSNRKLENDGAGKVEVRLDNLKPGYYYLHFKDEQSLTTKRFLVVD